MRQPVICLTVVLALTACGLQDANVPVPQPDTPIFGRIAAVREAAGDPGASEVEIKAGLPDRLEAVMRREGRIIPEMEKDLLVRVRVSPATVCVATLLATDLSAFRVGQEVAVLPVPGTITLTGTKLLRAEADQFFDFAAYELRFLPRAIEALPAGVADRSDAGKINSSGAERSPVPLRGGSVVYFAAGLLAPAIPIEGSGPRGAVREGMRDGSGSLAPWAVGGLRPYRVAWSGGQWEAPKPVVLPGLVPEAGARITWVNEGETECLVEVTEAGKPVRLMESRRAGTKDPWGPLAAVGAAKGESVGDAQRFFGKDGTYLVWTVYAGDGADLLMGRPNGDSGPLDPRINTPGREWSPRVGPNTTLYFCRGQRQLLFEGSMVHEVRLAGTQRRPLVEAAPLADGSALFVVTPRYTPGEPDVDIAVARRAEGGWGAAVPLDEWKPE